MMKLFTSNVAEMSTTTARAISAATRIRRSRAPRSEEHTSELQSRLHLVCRLLLEKKKKKPPPQKIPPLAACVNTLQEALQSNLQLISSKKSPDEFTTGNHTLHIQLHSTTTTTQIH